MSNVAGKAYAINAISPMRPWLTWLNDFSFNFARSKPSSAHRVMPWAPYTQNGSLRDTRVLCSGIGPPNTV